MFRRSRPCIEVAPLVIPAMGRPRGLELLPGLGAAPLGGWAAGIPRPSRRWEELERARIELPRLPRREPGFLDEPCLVCGPRLRVGLEPQRALCEARHYGGEGRGREGLTLINSATPPSIMVTNTDELGSEWRDVDTLSWLTTTVASSSKGPSSTRLRRSVGAGEVTCEKGS